MAQNETTSKKAATVQLDQFTQMMLMQANPIALIGMCSNFKIDITLNEMFGYMIRQQIIDTLSALPESETDKVKQIAMFSGMGQGGGGMNPMMMMGMMGGDKGSSGGMDFQKMMMMQNMFGGDKGSSGGMDFQKMMMMQNMMGGAGGASGGMDFQKMMMMQSMMGNGKNGSSGGMDFQKMMMMQNMMGGNMFGGGNKAASTGNGAGGSY